MNGHYNGNGFFSLFLVVIPAADAGEAEQHVGVYSLDIA